MVIVCHGTKGALVKESPAMGVYEQGLTVSWRPFRNTMQGVCVRGEVNRKGAEAKATSPQATRGVV